ncbi:MAG: hypothetical protein KGZ94_00130 [Clostridia bacterium]|nr:hypothetical protein [Clostridia bacterium]
MHYSRIRQFLVFFLPTCKEYSPQYLFHHYFPSVGRFISRDAFHGFEDDPASLNQYNYAHSNPVMFVDPSGYISIALNNGVSLGLSALVFVPGVGQVSLLGIAAAVGGAWLISKYGLPWAIQKYQISQISKSIPKSLKTPDGRVDLNKFSNKKPGSGPPTWLVPLGWYIQRDLSGHGGRVWKLFNWAGDRIASLAADGKILSK